MSDTTYLLVLGDVKRNRDVVYMTGDEQTFRTLTSLAGFQRKTQHIETFPGELSDVVRTIDPYKSVSGNDDQVRLVFPQAKAMETIREAAHYRTAQVA